MLTREEVEEKQKEAEYRIRLRAGYYTTDLEAIDQLAESHLALHDKVEEENKLFDSISCLCAEGPEFHSRKVLMDSIQKEAGKGYFLTKPT